jgi:cytochrome c-type biogenesis protein CcmH/NrfF
MDLIASSAVTSGVLTWALPIALLIGITIYWLLVLRRGSGGGA